MCYVLTDVVKKYSLPSVWCYRGLQIIWGAKCNRYFHFVDTKLQVQVFGVGPVP